LFWGSINLKKYHPSRRHLHTKRDKTIAEETKKMDVSLLKTQPNIAWQNIADMRNILAHDYRGIDPEIVFDVLKNQLPKLKTALLRLLNLFPENLVKEVLATKQYQHLKLIIFRG